MDDDNLSGNRTPTLRVAVHAAQRGECSDDGKSCQAAGCQKSTPIMRLTWSALRLDEFKVKLCKRRYSSENNRSDLGR